MKNTVRILGAAVLLLVLLCACSGKRYDETNISQLYDRTWIIGRSESEIVAKYGRFDRVFTLNSGEDVGQYNVNEYDGNWLDPNNIHDSYFVVFDASRIAVDAYFRQTSVGG